MLTIIVISEGKTCTPFVQQFHFMKLILRLSGEKEECFTLEERGNVFPVYLKIVYGIMFFSGHVASP